RGVPARRQSRRRNVATAKSRGLTRSRRREPVVAMDDFQLRSERRPSDGGVPARRAVTRWAWRLFWREWRQQFLILALITVAVAATILGSSVAGNNPPPKDAGFGTAPYS